MTESGLPTTSLSRSKISKPKRINSSPAGASPIAADGGFGPMDYEVFEDEVGGDQGGGTDKDVNTDRNEGFGEEFDDFEAGTEGEEFGDFDEGFQQSAVPDEQPAEIEAHEPSVHTLTLSTSSFVSKIMMSS